MIKYQIERKRNGESLSPAEWRDIVFRYAAGDVPDYQMSALCMAVYFQGLSPEELEGLTDAMLGSGGRLEFSSPGPRIDKHSTGGVGDKVSLVLAPIVASCGVSVPMMSGRGLGHTGGTLDKLEAIPGFRTDLTLEEAVRQTDSIGCALLGQTEEIAPADRKLYALRDVTATVASIPLISASIMSKKLAEGISGLVLDVKHGSGAFLPDEGDGLALARAMIGLGEARGCTTVALLTAMDRPLGRACGNANEVREAINALHGRGPDDLMQVTLALCAEMLLLGNAAPTLAEARSMAERAVESGRALTKFAEIIETQGGDPRVVEDTHLLPRASEQAVLAAWADGFVRQTEPRAIGRAIVSMGGGRQSLDDVLDPTAGVEFTAKPGDRVNSGDPIALLYARDVGAVNRGVAAIRAAVEIGREPAVQLPLISHRMTVNGTEATGIDDD